MSQIRSFDHLVVARQLYQDALESTEKGDRLLLTRAIIILDLSIDLALKSILLNLDPNFLTDKGKGDISFPELWKKTSEALKKTGVVGLSERSECAGLHAFRNLVQHHGYVPSVTDLRRYLESTRKMLTQAFKDAFDLDFGSLRPWDFVDNDDLRRLLNESEQFLSDGNPIVSMIGCKLARDLIVGAIRRHTKDLGEESWPALSGRAKEDAVNCGEFGRYLLKVTEYNQKRITRLEDEIVLIGFGLSTADTRKFLRARGVTTEKTFGDGHMNVAIHGKPERTEVEAEATFMLDYLYRLLRTLTQSNSAILNGLALRVPLSEQGISGDRDWFK